MIQHTPGFGSGVAPYSSQTDRMIHFVALWSAMRRNRYRRKREQMIQQEEHAPLPLSQRSIRDRVGIFSEATDMLDAKASIREAEQASVRRIWAQNAGNADLLTLFAVVVTQTEQIRLGAAIVPSYPRHPLALAQQAFAVHHEELKQ